MNLPKIIGFLILVILIFVTIIAFAAKRIRLLRNQLVEIRRQIKSDTETLRANQQIKRYLDAKVQRIISLLKLSCGILLLAIFASLLTMGYDPINAFLSAFALVSTSFLCVSIIFLNKTKDTNSIIQFVEARIQKWVYYRHKFYASSISILENRIEECKNEEITIEAQLGRAICGRKAIDT